MQLQEMMIIDIAVCVVKAPFCVGKISVLNLGLVVVCNSSFNFANVNED